MLIPNLQDRQYNTFNDNQLSKHNNAGKNAFTYVELLSNCI